jgi:FAD/FMN-containing dehydrogenase
MGGSAFTLAWKFLPEVWMAITGGIPKLVVLAEFTGDDASDVDSRATRAEFDLISKGFNARKVPTANEAKKYWTFRRESFNLLRSKVKGMRTACFVDDVVVNPEHLPEFLPKVYAILDKYNFLYTIAGHVGDGNFHIIPLVDKGNPKLGAVVQHAMDEVFKVVFSFKGSMSGEHNDGLIRTHLLKDMYGEKMVSFFEKVKDTFDPQNIFNPRKKAHGDQKWAFDHVDY